MAPVKPSPPRAVLPSIRQESADVALPWRLRSARTRLSRARGNRYRPQRHRGVAETLRWRDVQLCAYSLRGWVTPETARLLSSLPAEQISGKSRSSPYPLRPQRGHAFEVARWG